MWWYNIKVCQTTRLSDYTETHLTGHFSPTQCPSVVAEIILYSWCCHLKWKKNITLVIRANSNSACYLHGEFEAHFIVFLHASILRVFAPNIVECFMFSVTIIINILGWWSTKQSLSSTHYDILKGSIKFSQFLMICSQPLYDAPVMLHAVHLCFYSCISEMHLFGQSLPLFWFSACFSEFVGVSCVILL